MSNIIGDKKALQHVENSKPGDPSVYVNMDAIRMLPDTYEARITTVPFDAAKDFDDVGNGNFMPNPAVMNAIANARGIEGTKDATSEPIQLEININPMIMKGLEDPPTYRKMIVGHRSTKKGFVIQEDGQGHYSDACIVEYNVFDRCVAVWAKEEMYTDGYQKKGQYPNKYDTKHKRQLHFAEEMKFAQRKADTKARHVVIRVLAGLKTGYKKADLSAGSFYFPSIKLSGDTVKLREAARVEALRMGRGDGGESAVAGLFGQDQIAAPEVEEQSDDAILLSFSESNDIVQEAPKPEWQRAIDAMQYYLDGGWMKDDPDMISATEQMIGWLKRNEDRSMSSENNWIGILTQIKKIEILVDDGKYFTHALDLD